MEPPTSAPSRPPRDNIVRASWPGSELRTEATEIDGLGTLTGHFSVFDAWYEVDSIWEGHFLERIAPGSFKKTFRENRDAMRITFNHGQDPSLGDKVLGPIDVLEEDGIGARYETPLFDTSYNRDLLPGLKAGVYGASFRFRVLKEEFDQKPKVSDHNPLAIPERTIKEVQVMEFGPVTFPASPTASAGVRSLTDVYAMRQFVRDPQRLANLIESMRDTALPADGADPGHSDEGAAATPVDEPPEAPPDPPPAAAPDPQDPPDGGSSDSRENAMPPETIDQYPTRADKAARISEIKSELSQIGAEHPGVLPDKVQARWDDLDGSEQNPGELRRLESAVKAYDQRSARLAALASDTTRTESEPATEVRSMPAVRRDIDPYDMAGVYRDSRNVEEQNTRFHENALRILERQVFPQAGNQEKARDYVGKLLSTIDYAEPSEGKVGGELARRIAATGNPTYRRALGKYIQFGNTNGLTPDEQRALSVGTGSAGGFAITFELDPTIVPTSNSSVNPYRAACRVVTISGTNEWRGVSSGAVTAQYRAEAAATTDNSPTLAQPAFIVQRADAFVPFSIEVGQDWAGLQSEMGRLFQDAKDDLEATQFATGAGTTVFPQGITIGATNTATTATTTVLAVGDIYKTEEALPPRFRARAQWFANRFIYNKVRQLDTAGGANLWIDNLRLGLPTQIGSGPGAGNTGANLIGYPANESTAMAATLATTTKLAVLGDPSYYVIVDRIGMDIEVVPHLFGAGQGNQPTGQRGLFAYWRNTGRVFSANAFVTLVGL